MSVQITVSDSETNSETKLTYTLRRSRGQDGNIIFFLSTNVEIGVMSLSEENLYGLLDRYFEEEF